MVCGICGQAKATVHVTEFVEGKTSELHMCDKCATEKELNTQVPFSLNDLLSGLIQFTSKNMDPSQTQTLLGKCPGCQFTIENIKKTGKVGCPKCYDTFAAFLIPLVQKIQGSLQHRGKEIRSKGKVTGVSRQQELQQLEVELKRQIEREDYEQAALLRDKIKLIRSQEKATPAAGAKKTKTVPKTKNPPKKKEDLS